MDVILTKKIIGIGNVGDPVSVDKDRARIWVMSHMAHYANPKDHHDSPATETAVSKKKTKKRSNKK